MKKAKNTDWIAEADQMIRQGQGQKVRDMLTKIQRRGVPQDQLLECAYLARRVGMFSFAVNILFKSVYQSVGNPEPAHVAEYAANSSAAGNYVEAARLFEGLPEDMLASYAIEYADSLFKMWDYERASKHLQKYSPKKYKSYRDLVYGLNHASALIETDQVESAELVLQDLLQEAESHSYEIILANVKELTGQLRFREQNFFVAEQLFTESEDLLRSSGNVSWLYSRKWRVVAEMAQAGWSPRIALKLNEVKKMAREFMHWETLRECDLFEALFSNNKKLFQRVYFGTPHVNYRQRVLKWAGDRLTLDPKVTLGRRDSNLQYDLDVSWGDFVEKSKPLKLAAQSRKLIQVLTSDLYRPVSIYEIFQTLFDEPYFNPFTSKDRTYKAIASLKKKLVGHPARLTITSRKGYGYRLRSETHVNLIYPSLDADLREHSLLKSFGNSSFSRKQFCETLGFSERSGNRRLRALVQEGFLQKVGSGSSTRYKKSS